MGGKIYFHTFAYFMLMAGICLKPALGERPFFQPAGVNDNPSFEIGLGYGINHLSAPAEYACQATLIDRRLVNYTWRCTFVTAHHCVESAGRKSKPSFILTSDFGPLSRFVIVDQGNHYGAQERDLALVHFQQGCSAKTQKLVVPIGTLPEKTHDRVGLPIEVYVASLALNRLVWGFFENPYKKKNKEIWVVLGSGQIDGYEESYGIYSGDSGGGLFLKNKQTQALELVGVLSSGMYPVKNPKDINKPIPRGIGSPHALFVSDLEWINKQLEK